MKEKKKKRISSRRLNAGMTGLAKNLHRLIRRVGELTDGQACVCDMALEDGRVDNFRVEIRPNDGYYEGGVFKFRVSFLTRDAT